MAGKLAFWIVGCLGVAFLWFIVPAADRVDLLS
jgi:hypothetical protein